MAKLEKIQDPNPEGCTVRTSFITVYILSYLYIVYETLVSIIFLGDDSSGRKYVGYNIK